MSPDPSSSALKRGKKVGVVMRKVTTAKGRSAASRQRDTEGLFSISALADLFESDRATVRKYLKGVKPAVTLPKLKQYRLTDKNRAGKTVKELLESIEDPKFAEARARKMIADAERSELRVEIDKGERVLKSEVRDYAFNLAKSMHNFWLRYGKNSGRRLGLKPDKVRRFNADIEQFFTELRRDHTTLL